MYKSESDILQKIPNKTGPTPVKSDKHNIYST